MSLIFNEAEHTYHVGDQRLRSVTQVLSDAGIVDYESIPAAIREAALQRGRFVHMLTEFDDLGQLNEESVDPSLAGYLEGWRKFRRETGFTPELIEHRAVNLAHAGLPAGSYAGTLDRTGRFRGDQRLHLVDLKTGTAMEWAVIQLAAYAAFFPAPRLFKRYCVELHDDGSYRVAFVREGRDWFSDFNVFLDAFLQRRAA